MASSPYHKKGGALSLSTNQKKKGLASASYIKKEEGEKGRPVRELQPNQKKGRALLITTRGKKKKRKGSHLSTPGGRKEREPSPPSISIGEKGKKR